MHFLVRNASILRVLRGESMFHVKHINVVYEIFLNLQGVFMNRGMLAIADNTARDVMRQAVFYLIAGGGVALVLCSFSFTLFAFGEESRMIRDMGISTITMCCLTLASLSAANTISKELEKGTIMTLLSKPVGKHSIIVGKFLGILAAVSVIFMLMGAILTCSLCIQASLDGHIGFFAALIQVGYSTIFQLVFSFLPIAMLCAIATAGSIFLGMISNLCCCMVIYVFGNLMSFFHGALRMYGDCSAWCLAPFFVLFPNLEEFSAVGGKFGSLSLHHVALLMIYAVLYITFVIVLSCEFFDKKECR